MAAKRRVAVMLELGWPLKRHIALFTGTQRFAAEHDHWECIVDEFVDETLRQAEPGQRPYHGVIARATTKLARQAAAHNIPVVNVWANSPVKSLPTVVPDFEAAGQLSAEHLLARGFRHFACVARRDKAELAEMRTFAKAVHDAGFDCQPLVLTTFLRHTLQSWKTVQRELSEWMDRWTTPIAVVAGVEEVGRAIAQECAKRGLRIPLDVALIAGANDQILCELPPPRLTSIEIGYERVGYEAARWLDALMMRRSSTSKSGTVIVPPTGIVSRESTDFFAAEDELVAAALRFVADNARKPIGVDDVARAVHVSRPTIERRFRKHLGRSIGAEIRRLRIERAKRLLTDNIQPVKSIARDVGFSNAAALNAAFRSATGLSPGQYRRSATPRTPRRSK